MTIHTPFAKSGRPFLATLSACLLPILVNAETPPAATPQLKSPMHDLEEVGWQDVTCAASSGGLASKSITRPPYRM